MTSITALAQAAHTTTPAFNHDFYTTAAAVIPVLFLAINIQPVYQLQKWAIAGEYRPRRGLAHYYRMYVVTVAVWIVYALLLGGIVGESVAISALYNQSPISADEHFVLVITIALTAAVGAGPLLSLSGVTTALNIPESAAVTEPDKTDPAQDQK